MPCFAAVWPTERLVSGCCMKLRVTCQEQTELELLLPCKAEDSAHASTPGHVIVRKGNGLHRYAWHGLLSDGAPRPALWAVGFSGNDGLPPAECLA